MAKTKRLKCLPPVIDRRSRVLILGSFPGPMSLARRQYYAYPRNQFWKIVSAVIDIDPPSSYSGRIASLRKAGIGLWDVIASCRRHNASDANILDPVYNDIASLLKRYPRIRRVYCNGSKSFAVCRARQVGLGVPVQRLPSTSPANAACSYTRKLREWNKICRRIA
jgi:hypoxanthine-DNA glycosylase